MTPTVYAIDITACPVEPTGVGRYIYQLARALQACDFAEDERLLVLGRWDQRDRPELCAATFIDCGAMSVPQRILWEQTRLPALVRKHGVRVLHSPNYTTPIFASCKRVVTIHDLTCFLYPRRRKFLHALFFRRMIRYSVRHADRIIAVSHNTKNDIQRVLRTPGDHIVVIHEAPGLNYRATPSSDVNAIKARLGLRNPYFLFVGTMEPSKNIQRLVHGFTAFRTTSGQSMDLLLVGKRGWGNEALIASVERGAIPGVRYAGYLNDELLPALYAGALAFVYPSLYEGFGIPPLEAMSCATPVLCSNTSSLPEVAGDAALTFDPYNEEAIAHAFAAVACNEGLRHQLVAAGLQRVKQFTWKKTADSVLAIYRCLAGISSG